MARRTVAGRRCNSTVWSALDKSAKVYDEVCLQRVRGALCIWSVASLSAKQKRPEGCYVCLAEPAQIPWYVMLGSGWSLEVYCVRYPLPSLG